MKNKIQNVQQPKEFIKIIFTPNRVHIIRYQDKGIK